MVSTRAEIITRRTYNRPKNEEGTEFESWAETVSRVIDHQEWLWTRAAGGRELTDVEYAELYDLERLMLERKVLVSGRTLWLGGTDVAKQREASQFNCFRRSERFVTNKGIKSFEDFEEGDEVEVLQPDGTYEPAIVHRYGKQALNKVTFKRSGRGHPVEVYVTPNHTWYTKGGVSTTTLKVGDYLDYQKFSFWEVEWDSMTTSEQFWWCYGFVYGDGTVAKSGGSITSRVRLCGAKSQYLSRFEEMGFQYSFPPSCNSDPIVYTGKYQKTLPDLTNTDVGQLTAFLRGWLDADGHKSKNYATRNQGNIYEGIQITGEEDTDFFINAAAICGLYVVRKEDRSEETTNYGRRSDSTTYLSINSYFNNTWMTQYKVIDIESTDIYEEVWCLEVPETKTFILDKGLVTGNCSFTEVETVYDVVDVLWLLLQGCGVGAKPVIGTLNGFSKPIKNIEVVRSQRTEKGGNEHNEEFWDPESKTWTIRVGDSAEAWAKSIGKLMAGKYPARTLVLDFSELRPAGERLKGYGWISSGDAAIAKAYTAIAKILNGRADALLSRIDIMDIINWLGTILSSRRSAEIILFEYGQPEWEEFAVAKKDFWLYDREHRTQSNNSLLFNTKPTYDELAYIFQLMQEAGGSEPGFINAVEARRRAPWCAGFNPCVIK